MRVERYRGGGKHMDKRNRTMCNEEKKTAMNERKKTLPKLIWIHGVHSEHGIVVEGF